MNITEISNKIFTLVSDFGPCITEISELSIIDIIAGDALTEAGIDKDSPEWKKLRESLMSMFLAGQVFTNKNNKKD